MTILKYIFCINNIKVFHFDLPVLVELIANKTVQLTLSVTIILSAMQELHHQHYIADNSETVIDIIRVDF
jgi:hypothetical protein